MVGVFLIAGGIMAKYSHNDGWSALKKYWVLTVVVGVLYLTVTIIKYSMQL